MKTKLLILLSFILVVAFDAQAGSATWSTNPVSGDWNDARNWTPNTVPNGPNDVATFGHSNITAVSISDGAEVNTITFDPGASAFTITLRNKLTLTVSGTGIINNSGIMQNFITAGVFNGGLTLIQFTGTATAGDLAMFTNEGNSFSSGHCETNFFDDSTAGTATFVNESFLGSNIVEGGRTQFFDRSSAAEGTFINLGTDVGYDGGATIFMGDSTAADGTFIVHRGEGGAAGTMSFLNSSNAGNGTFVIDSSLTFSDTASAANGIFTVNDGAFLSFSSTSTIGKATLIANGGENSGGVIFLFMAGTEGTARVELFDNGTLWTQRDLPGVGIGSLEGSGIVDLGRHNPLIVGSNDLSTTFSGTIFDNGLLEKVGKGTLTLSGANTYTGNTTISDGILLVNNSNGSGTGTGAVRVDAGTLGGNGIIAGATAIGTGSGTGAFLAPALGPKKQSTLTIQSALNFNSDATYIYTFRARGEKARSDKVIANGVTINSGAFFAFQGTAQGTLNPGLSFTAISNTGAAAIAGTFSNLPDGAILTVNGNNFQADYEGGDGNDLTLTVVP